jgi:hypothetical protein
MMHAMPQLADLPKKSGTNTRADYEEARRLADANPGQWVLIEKANTASRYAFRSRGYEVRTVNKLLHIRRPQ